MRKMFIALLCTLIIAVVLPIRLFSSGINIGQLSASVSLISKGALDRNEVLNIIKRAIELNENFKSMVNRDENEYLKKRAEVEKYYEEILSPTLVDVVQHLSEGRDVDLAVEFINLLISYANSADEQLSYSLGEIFLKNPDLINEVFYKFEGTKQKIIYNQLKWGYENVVYSMDKSSQLIKDRYKLLQYLKSMTER